MFEELGFIIGFVAIPHKALAVAKGNPYTSSICIDHPGRPHTPVTAAAAPSNFNQRLSPLGMPFGVHIDLITSMANLAGGFFFVPQVPPAPRCTPVVIPTKLTSRLSLAPCCACQPSFGHVQAAPRRALAPVESPPGLVIWPVSGTKSLPVWSVWSLRI
jgi:hypothetical protein